MLLAAADKGSSGAADLLVPLGGAAALLSILGILLLLPLYITHRREILSLLDWKEREPDAGTTEFRAISPGPDTAAPFRPSGTMSAAERVTAERPALARIGTAERAALEIEQPPLWRRVLERGPRHPLVLTLLALLLAAAVFVAAGLLIRSTSDDSPKGAGIDPASVEIVVLNAASSSGVAGDVADQLVGDGFSVTATSVAAETSKQSRVFYATGAKPEARAVARDLGLPAPRPFDAEAEAIAGGADAVVIAGEDRARPQDGGKG